MPPRDEDDWHDPSDEEADEWRGGEPPDQGDEWKPEKRDWGTGPEHTLDWDGF